MSTTGIQHRLAAPTANGTNCIAADHASFVWAKRRVGRGPGTCRHGMRLAPSFTLLLPIARRQARLDLPSV